MSEAKPVWQEFDPSTFTFVGRNDVAVKWVLRYREEHKFSFASEVLLLGSGMVEPFTIAALSPDIKVTAVEMNEELVGLGELVKKGAKIPWNQVAEKSLNPGRPNTDLSEQQRLAKSLSVLKNMGSLEALGEGFDLNGIYVDPKVRERVTFVKADALSALKVLERKRFDLVGDFFLRVNINKSKSGPGYTREMLGEGFDCLNDNGMLLIGDTGRNLPVTYEQFAGLNTLGRLNLSSVVIFGNIGTGKITSHYLLATKLSDFPGSNGIIQKLRSRLEKNPILRKLEPIREGKSIGDQATLSTKVISIAYVDSGKTGESSGWNSLKSQAEALEAIIPNTGDEVSETVIFDAQKPYLQRSLR